VEPADVGLLVLVWLLGGVVGFCLGRAFLWFLRTDAVRRAICAQWGHAVLRETRGEPVASFPVCRRCGKWWRA
jgi:hypothetical protein